VLPKVHGKIDYEPIIHDVVKENPQIKHIIQARGEKGKNGRLDLETPIAEGPLTKENLKALEGRRPDPDVVSRVCL
jgi:hypothetical protein